MKKHNLWLTVFLVSYAIVSYAIAADHPAHPADGAKPTPAREMPSAGRPAAPSFGAHPFQGRVVETMDSAGYTYLLVDDGSQKVWAAAPQSTVAVGETVIVPRGMVMRDFHSSTLGRDFDWILFVGTIDRPGADQPAGGDKLPAGDQARLPSGHPTIAEKGSPAKIDLTGIEKADGGQTVEEIFAKRADLAGKKVLVRGKVVKFTAQVLGTNWIHLRDGSGSEGTNDLTVTTSTTVAVGDTVTVSGVLGVDKDFGAGYSYTAIVESADVRVE